MDPDPHHPQVVSIQEQMNLTNRSSTTRRDTLAAAWKQGARWFRHGNDRAEQTRTLPVRRQAWSARLCACDPPSTARRTGLTAHAYEVRKKRKTKRVAKHTTPTRPMQDKTGRTLAKANSKRDGNKASRTLTLVVRLGLLFAVAPSRG